MTPKRFAFMILISAPMVAIYFTLRQGMLAHLGTTEDIIAAIVIGGSSSFIIEYISPRKKEDEDQP